MRALRAIIHSLWKRARFERELREEIRAHIEHRADDLVREGQTRREAVQRARVEFGAIEAYKEQCREASGLGVLRFVNGFSSDLRLAGRRLSAAPLFTAFATLSLAVGLSVTTVAYSLVSGVFFQGYAIEDEDRIAVVLTRWEGKLVNGGISTPDFYDLRETQKSFASITASAVFFPAIASPSTTELMRGEAVDGAYFQTFGVRPALGRLIDQQDVAQASAVVVISQALWRLRFGADPKIVGQMAAISGRPFEIIGVAPKNFEGLAHKFKAARIWIPLSAGPRNGVSRSPDRNRPHLVVAGRLAAGASVELASAELASIGANLDVAYPRPADPKASGPQSRGWVAKSLTMSMMGCNELILVTSEVRLELVTVGRGQRHGASGAAGCQVDEVCVAQSEPAELGRCAVAGPIDHEGDWWRKR